MPSIDGIVSGLDTTSLIKAILTAHTVSINTLKNQSADVEKRKESVASFKAKLVSLSDAIKEMDTASEFRSAAVTSTSSQFKVTADSSAVPGAYSIKVGNLATAQTSVSDGWDDKTAAQFGTGTLSVTVGGKQTDLTIDNTNDSLAGIAAALNGVSGLSAYVIDTGAATGRYKLLVQGLSTGAANGFSIDTSGLSGSAPAFTTNTSAVDATVEIGGVTVHVASNTLDGAIPGIKVELIQPGAQADTAVVSRDGDAMKDKLKKVVDAYNAVQDYFAQQNVYNVEKDLRGPLIGESSTRRAIGDLAGMITNRFTVPGTSLSSLSELGIKTEQNGKLTLDESVFDDRMASDPDAVTTFLTGATGPLVKVRDRIDDLYVDEDNGTLTSTVNGLGDTVKDIEQRITEATDRMDVQTQILRNRFSAMEVALSNLKSTSSYLSALFGSSSASSTTSG